ncbi:MAG: hypothetical protein ABSC48_19805 [Terracidiphilus sp.]|jgi:hypothetical protein
MVIPRGWTNADAVAAMREFFAQRSPRRAAIRELMKELLSESPFDRRCAADLARRVSEREPGILKEYAGVLIDLAAQLPLDQWQARGYVTLAATRNASTHAERMRLATPVRVMLDDERIALRAIALEAFAVLAAAEPELREEAMLLLERCRRNGTCAERSRARRMLLLLLKAENEAGAKRSAAGLDDYRSAMASGRPH